MANYTIKAPVAGFTGTVAGVAFADGVATCSDQDRGPALAYFRSAGYGIEPIEEPEPAKADDGDLGEQAPEVKTTGRRTGTTTKEAQK